MTATIVEAVRRIASAPRRSKPQPPAGPSPRQDAINKIMAETDCSESLARRTLMWASGFVRRARGTKYRTQYPAHWQLHSDEYHIFDRVIPHGLASTPGSAHEAIEKAVLDPFRNEYSLRHDMDGSRYCTVDILVGAVG